MLVVRTVQLETKHHNVTAMLTLSKGNLISGPSSIINTILLKRNYCIGSLVHLVKGSGLLQPLLLSLAAVGPPLPKQVAQCHLTPPVCQLCRCILPPLSKGCCSPALRQLLLLLMHLHDKHRILLCGEIYIRLMGQQAAG